MATTTSVCIVLDGANVATRKTGEWVIPRLAAALNYFRDLQKSRQCSMRCVAFVPNFWLNTKSADGSKGNGSMETDDSELLKRLVDEELVVLTPSHAHDDFYVIDYAVKNDGFIVTNDMFRDHVQNKRVFNGRKLTQSWTRSRCIDFTFVGNEFLPNSQAIERALVHVPQPSSPRDTIAATATPSTKDAVETVSAQSLDKTSVSPKPRTPRPKPSVMRSSSLTKAISTPDEGEDDASEDQADEANSMSIDQVRKRNVDLAELTAYRVPRYLLPLLHGDDGQTMGRFMDHTNTYIVAPALNTNATSDVATLSIYGSEPNRMHAVKILDAALPELQQQHEFQIHQQQQQQWLLAQAQQQQQQYHPQQHIQDAHNFQQQHLFQQQQLHQQQYMRQQQYLQQQQQQQHHHHLPANYPLQPHHAHGGDDGMEIELE